MHNVTYTYTCPSHDTKLFYNGLFTNLNGGQCKHNLLFSIDVRVQYTQNVLKLLRNYKGLWKQYEFMRKLTQYRTWRREKQEINEENRNFNKKDVVLLKYIGIKKGNTIQLEIYWTVQNFMTSFTVEQFALQLSRSQRLIKNSNYGYFVAYIIQFLWKKDLENCKTVFKKNLCLPKLHRQLWLHAFIFCHHTSHAEQI